MSHRVAAAVALLSCTLAVSVARAQAFADTGAADVLLEDGKKLVAAGHAADACPKFAEADRLAPSIPALIHLGDCYERVGKTGSAWGAYKEAAARAQARGQVDVEADARRRADALEPRLARVVVNVPASSRVPALEITRGASALSQPTWALALPVDPGLQTVVARAPGRAAFRASVVATPGTTVAVDVPVLELVDPPVVRRAPPPGVFRADKQQEVAYWSTERVFGLALGVVGVGGLVTGAVLRASAAGASDDVKAACAASVCTQAGLDRARSARAQETASNVALIAGAVGVAGGAVLWFAAPAPTKETSAGLQVQLGGASLVGTF